MLSCVAIIIKVARACYPSFPVIPILPDGAVFSIELLAAFELLEFCLIKLEPGALALLDHPDQRSVAERPSLPVLIDIPTSSDVCMATREPDLLYILRCVFIINGWRWDLKRNARSLTFEGCDVFGR